jgi:hypothetical protein
MQAARLLFWKRHNLDSWRLHQVVPTETSPMAGAVFVVSAGSEGLLCTVASSKYDQLTWYWVNF